MSKGGVEAGLQAYRHKKFGLSQLVRLSDQVTIESELSKLPSYPGTMDWGIFDDILDWYQIFRRNDLNREPGLKRGVAAWAGLATDLDNLANQINDLFSLGSRSPTVRIGAVETLNLVEFGEQARRLSNIVRASANEQEAAAERLPRIDFPKDYLYGRALEVWIACGGAIRTSLNAEGEPEGPLIRYLEALWSSAASTMGEGVPSRHSIREAIRKPRRQSRDEDTSGMGKPRRK